ncbi:hypothetical protein ACIBCA_13075 [Kitasatospora sp. NPDC051170]|uniref:hypothetical protein n=1 Tax=Kitasatospora sp. NPDC051170 TaxID=3364056 RepID=UPI0037AFBB9B
MTADDRDDLTARLTALADEAAPPARLDTARSIAEGTARRRRRRGMLIGAAAAVTCAVVATTALIAPGTGSGDVPSVGNLAAGAPAVSTPTPHPAGTDPLVADFRFGWLPDWADGEKNITYRAGADGTYGDVLSTDPGSRMITLSMYPAGVVPPTTAPGGTGPGTRDAAPVNGATAHWTVQAGSSDERNTLRWLTPSGRWAELSGFGEKPGAVPEETLHKVAENITFGRFAVPLPVRFTGLPETFKVTGVQLSRPDWSGPSVWSLRVDFRLDGKRVSVVLRPDDGGASGSPSGTPGPPLEAVRNGVRISITTDAGVPPTLEQLGGLPWLLTRTEAVGLDQGAWTTDVLR